MIPQPKSIIIGIAITIILIKFCKYNLFKSELLSSLVYITVFSLLYEMIRKFMNKDKKNENIVLEGYSSSSEFAEFEASDSFKGKRDGYVFKKDEQGLGYYLDK